MSEKEKIIKSHGRKIQRFNVKSCMSLFLCAVLLFTSIDYAQVQAEETTNKAAAEQEVSGSVVKDENITENPINSNEEKESANDAGSGKGIAPDMDTGNETIPGNADNTDTSNEESSGSTDGTDTSNEESSGNTDGTDTSNEEPSGTEDGTDTGNKETSGTEDGTENTDNPVNGDDSDKKDESDSSDDDKNSEDSGNSSETEDTENTENPDGSNEDGEAEGDTPTENPDESDEKDENKDKDDSPQESEDSDEIQFVTTAEGAIIISSFEQLSETDSKIVLDKKLPLDELTAMMPQTLKAYAYAYTTTENKADKTSSPDTGIAAKIQNKLKNAVAALTKGTPGNETTASTSDNPEGETAASTNDNPENEATASTSDNPDNETTTSTNDNSENETIAPAKDETTADTSGQTDEKETSLHELEIPVSWECSEDYDNTELESYDFTPSWDIAAYSYETTSTADEATNENISEEANGETTEETSGEPAALPTITVTFDKNAKTDIVSTQEELEEAFASGTSKIVLAEDIALTRTLTLPASADTLLDGQGFSLTRGKDENGVFTGTMIYMGGDDYTKKDYGKLTLTDICIDGKTPNNRAGSSTIIDYGSLTLDKGAYIKNNSSYGTYEYDDNGKLQTLVDDFGGGVQVYGELKVTEHSLITGNFADEFGGGVYLADESVLYLYADVIKENSVAEGTGYGADLYAASGSTIYYDSSIDMEREGFYICEGVELICLQELDEETEIELYEASDRHDDKVEVYLSIAEGSGYSAEQITELESKLEALGYSIISKRTNIDVTDLRDWYVFDHYDTHAKCWDPTDNNGNKIPDAWEAYYGGNPRRKYYPDGGSYAWSDNSTRYGCPKVEHPAYTIPEWLESIESSREYYDKDGDLCVEHFKEHIYQGMQGGRPLMTFVGYGWLDYVDFLFYDPQSTGEKVVDFDLESSKVNIHTLQGAGFLVNTGIENDILSGYLIFYDYDKSATGLPRSINIYKIEDINAASFHGGKRDTWQLIASNPINANDWNKNLMNIQFRISPNKIEVKQQSASEVSDRNAMPTVLECELETSKYSGFGPLVAYTKHTCPGATTFTYSNISMYYTNPTQAGQNLLQALEKADYTQDGTQKYFVNLFGTSGLDYNNAGVETQIYQEYLKLMQTEGVALITDRTTPFKTNLGESGEAGSNLCELERGLSVDELVNRIKEYVDKQETTYMQDKLQSDEDGGLTNAAPSQPAGNCWLKATPGNEQVRTIYGDSLSDVGYTVQIIDDISYYHEGSNITGVTYEILKAGASEYTPVSTIAPSGTASFTVENSLSDWPAGNYTVRQTIHTSQGDASIHGYSYFDIKRNDETGHSHSWSEWTVDVEPTCTLPGHRYTHCETCEETIEETIPAAGHKPKDEWAHDETGHWHICSVCSVKLDTFPHEFEKWEHDDDKHWHECICGYITDDAEHKFGNWLHDDDKHWKECICGYIIDAEHKFEEWGYNLTTHWRACSICKARTKAVEHDFGEWVSDKDKHWRECECGIRNNEAEHDFEEWLNDENSHWHECICGVGTEPELHEGTWITEKEATEDEEGSKYRICDMCNYRNDLIIPKLPHEHKFEDWLKDEHSHWRECRCGEKTDLAVHDWDWETDKEATEDEEGSRHRICSVCEYREDEIIPPIPHEHDFANLRHDETKHWRECRCGEKTDEARHNFGEWITDRLASEDADGQKHRECSVCEYIERDVIKLGNVTKREDCGENAPRTVISTELRAVVSVTLENEDIQEVKSGKDIDIILTVDDAGDTVSVPDQTAVTSVMGSYKLGQYLDVNLYKELNNNKSQITETKNVLRLVLDVPETLKKANSRLPRNFVIIRVHDGNAVILNDLDSDDNTITIDTDCFSTYAIVYADKKSTKRSKPATVDNTPDSNQIIDSFIEFVTFSAPPATAKKDAEPKTGNNSHVELYATIALIEGLSYLIYLFTFRYGFTEEKKDELIARLIRWAKQGGRLRRMIAIASIFMLLVYYHSIGKHLFIEWTQVYN